MAKTTGPNPFAKTFNLDAQALKGVREITSAVAIAFDDIAVGDGVEGKVVGVEWRQVKGVKNPVIVATHESGTDFAVGINAMTATALEKMECVMSTKEEWNTKLPNIDKIKGKYLLLVNLGKLEGKKYHNLRVLVGDAPITGSAPKK